MVHGQSTQTVDRELPWVTAETPKVPRFSFTIRSCIRYINHFIELQCKYVGIPITGVGFLFCPLCHTTTRLPVHLRFNTCCLVQCSTVIHVSNGFRLEAHHTVLDASFTLTTQRKRLSQAFTKDAEGDHLVHDAAEVVAATLTWRTGT